MSEGVTHVNVIVEGAAGCWCRRSARSSGSRRPAAGRAPAHGPAADGWPSGRTSGRAAGLRPTTRRAASLSTAVLTSMQSSKNERLATVTFRAFSCLAMALRRV